LKLKKNRLLKECDDKSKIIKSSDIYKNYKESDWIYEQIKNHYNNRKCGTGTFSFIQKSFKKSRENVLTNRFDHKASESKYPKQLKIIESTQLKNTVSQPYQELKRICDINVQSPLKFGCSENDFLNGSMKNHRFQFTFQISKNIEIIGYAKHNKMKLPSNIKILKANLACESKGYSDANFRGNKYFLILTIEGTFENKIAKNDKIIGLDWGHRERPDKSIKCFYGSSDNIINIPKPLVHFKFPNGNTVSVGDLAFQYSQYIKISNDQKSVEISLPPQIREIKDQIDKIKSIRQLSADPIILRYKKEMGKSKSCQKLFNLLRSKGDLFLDEELWLQNEKILKYKCDSLSVKSNNIKTEYFRKVFESLNRQFGHVVFEAIKSKNMRDLDKKGHTAHRKRSNRELVSKYFCEQLCPNKKTVPARNTTKNCHMCKTPNDIRCLEQYTCLKCGISIDRDYNASQNIKNLYKEALEKLTINN